MKGPLFALTTWMPLESASRMWLMAGSPVRTSVGVVSMRTSALCRADEVDALPVRLKTGVAREAARPLKGVRRLRRVESARVVQAAVQLAHADDGRLHAVGRPHECRFIVDEFRELTPHTPESAYDHFYSGSQAPSFSVVDEEPMISRPFMPRRTAGGQLGAFHAPKGSPRCRAGKTMRNLLTVP